MDKAAVYTEDVAAMFLFDAVGPAVKVEEFDSKRRMCQNSDSNVPAMRSAEERVRRDTSHPLNRTRQWGILGQRAMRSDFVVIMLIGLRRAAADAPRPIR